jgi:hypothetical protein
MHSFLTGTSWIELRLNFLLFQRSVQAYDAHMNWRCEVTETQLRINNVNYFMPDRNTMMIVSQLLGLAKRKKKGETMKTLKGIGNVIP